MQVDKIAIVNLGEEPADIWLHQKSANGLFVRSIRLAQDLAPRFKTSSTMGGPSDATFDVKSGDYFELSSTQALAASVLTGNADALAVKALPSGN